TRESVQIELEEELQGPKAVLALGPGLTAQEPGLPRELRGAAWAFALLEDRAVGGSPEPGEPRHEPERQGLPRLRHRGLSEGRGDRGTLVELRPKKEGRQGCARVPRARRSGRYLQRAPPSRSPS